MYNYVVWVTKQTVKIIRPRYDNDFAVKCLLRVFANFVPKLNISFSHNVFVALVAIVVLLEANTLNYDIISKESMLSAIL